MKPEERDDLIERWILLRDSLEGDNFNLMFEEHIDDLSEPEDLLEAIDNVLNVMDQHMPIYTKLQLLKSDLVALM